MSSVCSIAGRTIALPVLALPVLALVVLAGPLPAAAQAQRACAPFPHVAWWGDMTHDTVRAVVRDRYNGSWAPVIDGLTQQMSTMQNLKNQGRPYAVPNSTRQLGGDQLTVYLDQVRLTLSILYCVRDQELAQRRAPAAPTATPAPATTAAPIPATTAAPIPATPGRS